MTIQKQDSRIIIKSSTVSTVVPTTGPSSDHTDGTWNSTDVYPGELMFNTLENRAWFKSLYYTIGLATINGTAPLTANRVTVTDASGHITSSDMTATELASLSSGGTTMSGTYSYWSARKTASTLPLNRWIEVSDAGPLYLFCRTTSSFDLNGIWKNTVLSVDYYNKCEYDFTLNVRTTTNDFKGNVIHTYTGLATSVFPFNVANVEDNVSIGGGKLNISRFTFTGTLKRNLVIGRSGNIQFTGSGEITENVFISSEISGLSYAGILEKCVFEQQYGGVLDPAVSYSNKTIKHGYSDFNKTIPITAGVVTFDATYGWIVGSLEVTGGATETITSFVNAPNNHPFEIIPPGTMTSLTIQHNANTKCYGGFDVVLNGANGDRAWFIKRNSTVYQYKTQENF